MNILVITPDFPYSFGGIGEHVYNLYKNMDVTDCQIYIFVVRFAVSNLGIKDVSDEFPSNIRVIEFTHSSYREYEQVFRNRSGDGFSYEFEALKTEAYNLEIFMKMNEYIQNEGIEFDLIHLHDAFAAIPAVALKRMYHVPLVATDHSIGNELYVIDGIRAYMIRNASQVIYVSSYLQKTAAHRYNCGEIGTVIPNGINKTRYVKDRYDLQGRITYVGRLEKKKGVDILLKAIALLSQRGGPGLKLCLYGDGTEKENLQEYTAELGIAGQVDFYGYCDHEEVLKRMVDSDIVILPSREEAFGLTALEAMSVGVPVIASDIEAYKEFIGDGKNGILFKTENAFDLCEKIKFLLKNKEVRQQIGKAAVSVNREYSWKNISQKTKELYSQVVNENKPVH